MYWRSNSATASPFLTKLPGLAASCRTRLNSPPADPREVVPMAPGPPEPPLSEFDVEPRPSAPIEEEALDEEDDPREEACADELEELELTRLVAERIAEELRELDCAPLELETVSEPSAATVVEPPPEELPLEVPAAREATVVFELREALNDRLSRPKPDREPCN